jgi:hypothetical protein
MASIIQKKNRYYVVYLYDAEDLEDFDPEEFLEVRVEVLVPIPEEEREGFGPDDETWEVTDICWSNNIYKPEV